MKIIELDSIGSTSSYLASMGTEAPHGTIVTTREQTAGRGQRGNSWESAPGANVTMSMMLRSPEIPAVAPAKQFALSEHVALAVAATIRPLVGSAGHVAVKWPNDIYVDNRKIAGILLECAHAAGRLERMIAGIGLNVNQREFVSDAPNPVSLRQLTGREYELGPIVAEIGRRIAEFPRLESESVYPFPATHERYMAQLWRREGYHRYFDNENGEVFEAEIISVEPDGLLRLRHADGSVSIHEFKTVRALL